MSTENIILIFVAILDFIIALIVFFRNKKSPINASFGIMLLGASLWVFGIAMFRNTLDMEIAVSWARIYYFASAVIVLAFLTFANYYPYKSQELEITKIIYFLLPFLFITFIIFHPTFLLEKATHYEWGNDANEKFIGHFLFAIYFFSYLTLAYYLLFKKLKTAEGIIRINLLFVIIFTIIAFIFGVIFDLILPLLGNYKHIWVGPNFTSLASFLLIYLIFIRRLR